MGCFSLQTKIINRLDSEDDSGGVIFKRLLAIRMADYSYQCINPKARRFVECFPKGIFFTGFKLLP